MWPLLYFVKGQLNYCLYSLKILQYSHNELDLEHIHMFRSLEFIC